MKKHSEPIPASRVAVVFLLFVVSLMPMGCSEGPGAPDPAVAEASNKALAAENQTQGSGKGKNTTDLKSVKGRLHNN